MPSRFVPLFLIVALSLLMPCAPALAGKIHESVSGGDIETVQKMLEKNPKLVNARDRSGLPPWNSDTPLITAALHDRIAIGQLLISYGADVNARGGKGWSGIYSATVWGHEDFVKLLLAHHADINEQNKDGRTALHAAAANNQVELVKFFLAHHVDVNVADRDGNTPLWEAEKNGGSHEMVNVLLKAGAHE